MVIFDMVCPSTPSPVRGVEFWPSDLASINNRHRLVGVIVVRYLDILPYTTATGRIDEQVRFHNKLYDVYHESAPLLPHQVFLTRPWLARATDKAYIYQSVRFHISENPWLGVLHPVAIQSPPLAVVKCQLKIKHFIKPVCFLLTPSGRLFG
jgi:hypothetical protein